MHNKGFEVLEEFGEGLEEPRSDKIYSLGNRGVKKDPGLQGTRNLYLNKLKFPIF